MHFFRPKSSQTWSKNPNEKKTFVLDQLSVGIFGTIYFGPTVLHFLNPLLQRIIFPLIISNFRTENFRKENGKNSFDWIKSSNILKILLNWD